jgi:hypothetical protein
MKPTLVPAPEFKDEATVQLLKDICWAIKEYDSKRWESLSLLNAEYKNQDLGLCKASHWQEAYEYFISQPDGNDSLHRSKVLQAFRSSLSDQELYQEILLSRGESLESTFTATTFELIWHVQKGSNPANAVYLMIQVELKLKNGNSLKALIKVAIFRFDRTSRNTGTSMASSDRPSVHTSSSLGSAYRSLNSILASTLPGNSVKDTDEVSLGSKVSGSV